MSGQTGPPQLSTTVVVKAQLIVAGTDINQLDVQYIELVGYNRSSSEALVWIDYGRGIRYNRENEFLRPTSDQEGMRFFSLVEALNYVYKNGWELVAVSHTPTSSNDSYRYVLQRKSQASK